MTVTIYTLFLNIAALIFSFLLCTWGNWGVERGDNMPQVTQQMVQAQISLNAKHSLSFHCASVLFKHSCFLLVPYMLPFLVLVFKKLPFEHLLYARHCICQTLIFSCKVNISILILQVRWFSIIACHLSLLYLRVISCPWARYLWTMLWPFLPYPHYLPRPMFQVIPSSCSCMLDGC